LKGQIPSQLLNGEPSLPSEVASGLKESSMRYLATLLVGVLSCQIANGQPTPKELITKFRTTIGAEGFTGSIPYLIQYRGERFSYEFRDGKLVGESFGFEAKLYGYTDKAHVFRKETEMKIGVVPLKIVDVINGNSGWYQINEGDIVPLSKDAVEGRQKRELHVEVFLGRESFDPAVWQFSQLQSAQVRGRDAWTFEAKSKAQDGITLYFSKQSGLLLRLTSQTTDFLWHPGQKAKLESFTRDLYFHEWKDLGKRKFPALLEVFHDNVLWEQLEPVGLTLGSVIEPKLFEVPQPKK
jgi:hypothetical protein